MKYVPPYGVTDPNAAYVNGNPSTGVEGSIPPADAFNEPLRELHNLVLYNGLTPSDTQLDQVTRAVRRQFVNFGVDTGSVNQLSIALQPAPMGYEKGTPLRVLVGNTNTGACTLNNSGLGNRAIKRPDGSDLQPGDMHAGGIASLVDDGSQYQLTNFLSAPVGTASIVTVKIPYCGDISVTPNTITAVFSPALTSLIEGDFLAVKINNTNTGATTMVVNALPVLPVYRNDGLPVVPRDLLKNEVILFEFHGTYYQCMSFLPSQFRLNADLTLYVRTDGNDANNGSANDAAHAFKTIAACISYVKSNFAIAGRTVTIQLGIAGSYDPINVDTVPNGRIVVRGDPNNQDSYVIPIAGSQMCVYCGGSNLGVIGVYLSNTSGVYSHVVAAFGGQIALTNVTFAGAATTGNGVTAFSTGEVTLAGTIKFQVNMQAALGAFGGSITAGNWSCNIQCLGGPNFATAFAASSLCGLITLTYGWTAFSGAATGPSYLASANGIINTFGGGSNYLPGNQPGYTATGGWYF